MHKVKWFLFNILKITFYMILDTQLYTQFFFLSKNNKLVKEKIY